jgi:pimeloyl-ACP methyl ester carboxylesterase
VTTTPDRHLRDLRDEGVDPPIVLVPGIDGTALLFYRQQPLLAAHFDVVAFPLTTHEPDKMTMESLVADLALLIEEIADEKAIVIGESFGGALAMSLAVSHPELVAGLVIVNSFPYFDERLKLRIAPRLLRLVPWGAMPIVRRYTSGHLHSPHTDASDIEQFRERAKSIDRDSYIRRLEILSSYDLRDRLVEIVAPTLFLAGDRDRLVPSVRWATYMHERTRQSSMTVLEGYGHVCLIDHDLDLTEYVLPWWTDRSKSSADLTPEVLAHREGPNGPPG